MKFLATFLVLGFGIACARAALPEGTTSGHAKNVTIVNLEDGDGIVILTFSEPLIDGPACAAQHKNVLVIGNGNHSPDAERARRAYSLGQALEVWGGGNCKKVRGYETLAILQLAK